LGLVGILLDILTGRVGVEERLCAVMTHTEGIGLVRKIVLGLLVGEVVWS